MCFAHKIIMFGVFKDMRTWEEGEEFEDNMDVFDDSSSSPSGTLRNYPLTCKVVYSYKVCISLTYFSC